MLAESYTKKIIKIRESQQSEHVVLRLMNELKCEIRWDKSITLQQRKTLMKRIDCAINHEIKKEETN